MTLFWRSKACWRDIKNSKNWLYHLPYYDQITSCLNLKLSKNQRRLSNLEFISKIFKSGGNICYSKISQAAFYIKQRRLKFQSHPAKIYLFEVYKFIPFCKRFSPSSTLSRCVAIFIRRKNLSPLYALPSFSQSPALSRKKFINSLESSQNALQSSHKR